MRKHLAAKSGSAFILIGLLLVAANLRGPFTGVAPILATLENALQLSPTLAGLLTTLPLLAFSLISPLTATISRKVGLERTLCIAMALIVVGVLLRSTGSAYALFIGTAVIGIGIALGNVLMPSLVKRDFPHKVAIITGACALTMGLGAALASATVVPLTTRLGWQLSLGSAALLPIITLLLWASLWKRHPSLSVTTSSEAVAQQSVWRSALAWQVTLFMGINSLLYYMLVAWLPAILTGEGFSPEAAGTVHGVLQLATALPGLFLGPIVARLHDQRIVAGGAAALATIALAGFCLQPSWAMLWAFCFGTASGSVILLAFIFMALRTHSAHQAASLSGMAQCAGYLLAATGPTLAGLLKDATGSWSAFLYFSLVMSVVMLVFGVLAGRNRHLPA